MTIPPKKKEGEHHDEEALIDADQNNQPQQRTQQDGLAQSLRASLLKVAQDHDSHEEQKTRLKSVEAQEEKKNACEIREAGDPEQLSPETGVDTSKGVPHDNPQQKTRQEKHSPVDKQHISDRFEPFAAGPTKNRNSNKCEQWLKAIRRRYTVDRDAFPGGDIPGNGERIVPVLDDRFLHKLL